MLSNTYLDNLLHRDDVSSMPQADRLFWGESLEALLHHLQTEHVIIIINQLYGVTPATVRVFFSFLIVCISGPSPL